MSKSHDIVRQFCPPSLTAGDANDAAPGLNFDLNELADPLPSNLSGGRPGAAADNSQMPPSSLRRRGGAVPTPAVAQETHDKHRSVRDGLHTWWKCHRMGGWSETCVYHNLCWQAGTGELNGV